MTDHRKNCPLMISGGNHHISGLCIESDCAWWLPFAGDCAIPVAAGILADSTICNNIFDGDKEKN